MKASICFVLFLLAINTINAGVALDILNAMRIQKIKL